MRKTVILVYKVCLLALVAIMPAGCIRDIWGLSDLEFASVRLAQLSTTPEVDREDYNSIQRQMDLAIEFRSKSGTDLYRYADRFNYNMVSNASLCTNGRYDPTRELAIDSYLYGEKGMVKQSNKQVLNEKSRSQEFYFYVKLSVDEKYVGNGHYRFAYNLRKKPDDICFYLDGGSIFAVFLTSFTSNTVLVPRDAVSKAMETARSWIGPHDPQ